MFSDAQFTSAMMVAKQAGDKILEIYRSNVWHVEIKSDKTPLTEADLQAHAIIEQCLKKIDPTIPVLSEESAWVSFDERLRWQRYWLVDPLDGTKEFIAKSNDFTVNIALIDGNQPVFGVIHAPVLDVSYAAITGSGAFKQNAQGEITTLEVRSGLRERKVVAVSRRQDKKQLAQFLQCLGDYELLPMGSSLKFCLIAEGKADFYPRLGPTSEWDTAAGQCILQEAGGRLVDVNGMTLQYNCKDSLINPSFFAMGADSETLVRCILQKK